MTVKFEPYVVPFTSGIAGKVNEKALPAPKLHTLENGVFDELGAIKKRYGSTVRGVTTTAATTLSEAKALILRDDEVAQVGNTGSVLDHLWTYSAKESQWRDRGPVGSPRVTRQTLVANVTEQNNVATAATNGLRLVAWEEGGTVPVYYAFYDTSNGALLVAPTGLTDERYPKAVAAGNYIHLYTVDASLNLILRVFNTAGTWTSPTSYTVGSANHYGTYPTTTAIRYSSYSSGTVTFAYCAGAAAGYYLGRRNADGTQSVAATQFNSGAQFDFIDLDVRSAGDAIVAYGQRSVGGDVYARAFTNALAATAAQQTVLVGSIKYNCTIAIDPTDVGSSVYRGRVYITTQQGAFGQYEVYAGSIDTDGTTVTAATSWMRWSYVAACAFVVDDEVLVPVTIDTTPTTGSSRLGVQRSDVLYTHAKELMAWWNRDIAYVDVALSNVHSLGSGRFEMMRVYQGRVEYDHYSDATPCLITLDFDHGQVCRSVDVGGTTYIAGGLLQQYDGALVTEVGFLQYPHVTSYGASGGAAATFANGDIWSYVVTQEWTNARGEKERSAPSEAFQITGNGANKHEIVIETVHHTRKRSDLHSARNIAHVVWRTEANPTDDAPYYRCSATNPLASGDNGWLYNSVSAATVTFTDNLADASLISREILTTTELENIPPEAATIIARVGSRVFLAGLPDRPHSIQHSKIQFAGDVLSFNDALILDIDSRGGAIVGIGAMGDQVVVFKESAIYALVGAGPNNDGSGAAYEPKLVHAEVGCSDQRSIVEIPGGLMFKTPRGIYLLSQGWQLQYVGADVEDYNSQTITAATLIPSKHVVRFLCSSGNMLAYDYLVGQWAVFTAWTGIGAGIVNGAYLMLTSSGVIRDESNSVYTDNGSDVVLKVTTGWIRLSTLQGYQRVRRAWVIGDYKSTHAMRVEVGYDYASSFDDEALIVQTEEPVQSRVNLKKQKCEAVRFRISDTSLSGSKESYALVELRLDVGLKQGGFRLPATKTSGAT